VTIAVSGTRRPLTPAEEQRIYEELIRYEPAMLHVGDCPTGVDAFVRSWWPDALLSVFDADWTRGLSAGPIRNARILKDCKILIAFPAAGRQSKGTMNAIEQAIRAGLEVHVYPLGGHEGKSL